MSSRIDVTKVLNRGEGLPPSPRDRTIKALGIASLVAYVIAAVCAWNIGEWWGLGLVGALFVISTLDEYVHEQHREELVEMHGKLMLAIAENSTILDEQLPIRDSD